MCVCPTVCGQGAGSCLYGGGGCQAGDGQIGKLQGVGGGCVEGRSRRGE